MYTQRDGRTRRIFQIAIFWGENNVIFGPVFPLLPKFGSFREFLGFSRIISRTNKFQEFFQDIWRFWRKCRKLRKKHIRFCFAPNAPLTTSKCKNLSLWEGDTPLPHPPPPSLARARSLRPLAGYLYPPLKIKSWLRHWCV